MISSANSDRKEDNSYFKSVERWHGFTLGLNPVAAGIEGWNRG
jgi:hypothetical protein